MSTRTLKFPNEFVLEDDIGIERLKIDGSTSATFQSGFVEIEDDSGDPRLFFDGDAEGASVGLRGGDLFISYGANNSAADHKLLLYGHAAETTTIKSEIDVEEHGSGKDARIGFKEHDGDVKFSAGCKDSEGKFLIIEGDDLGHATMPRLLLDPGIGSLELRSDLNDSYLSLVGTGQSWSVGVDDGEFKVCRNGAIGSNTKASFGASGSVFTNTTTKIEYSAGSSVAEFSATDVKLTATATKIEHSAENSVAEFAENEIKLNADELLVQDSGGSGAGAIHLGSTGPQILTTSETPVSSSPNGSIHLNSTTGKLSYRHDGDTWSEVGGSIGGIKFVGLDVSRTDRNFLKGSSGGDGSYTSDDHLTLLAHDVAINTGWLTLDVTDIDTVPDDSNFTAAILSIYANGHTGSMYHFETTTQMDAVTVDDVQVHSSFDTGAVGSSYVTHYQLQVPVNSDGEFKVRVRKDHEGSDNTDVYVSLEGWHEG